MESVVYYPRCYAVLQVLLNGFDDEGDGEDEQVEIPIFPKRATIHANSYKQADSYELTFDADDLPIDPNDIRAIAVEIFLYQTPALDQGSFVIADPGDEALVGETQAPRIAGLVDEPGMSLAVEGKEVSLRGQDYTAYLAGRQWPPKDDGTARRIKVGRPLLDVVKEIVDEADPMGILDVKVEPGLKRMPTVDAGVNAQARGVPIDQSTSYWDVIYKLALRCGLIAYVEGTTVWLAPPHTVDEQDQSKIVRFAWGANVERLELSRRMGRVSAPTVVMRGVDNHGRVIEAQFPGGFRAKQSIKNKRNMQAKTKKTSQRIKGTPQTATTSHRRKSKKPHLKALNLHKRDEFEIIPAANISDPAILAQVAEARWRFLAHGERKAVLKTAHLRDFKYRDFQQADLLKLKSGDAVTIDFRDYNTDYVGNDDIAPSERIGYLMARGYKPQVAEMLVAYGNRVRMLRRPLRVKEATFNYDCDRGVALEIELQDFIQVGDVADGQSQSLKDSAITFRQALGAATGQKP